MATRSLGRATGTLLALLTVACTEPVIRGVVADHLGQPTAAVKVQLIGTSISVLTEPDGSYALPYIPGTMTVQVNKDGYLPVRRQYDIAVASEFPAAPVILYPYEMGFTLSAMCDGGAVGLARVALEKGESSRTMGLRTVPSTAVPSDCWGFVWVPSEQRVGGDKEPLELLLSALQGPSLSTRFELRSTTWRATDSVKRYRGWEEVALQRWVPGAKLEVEQFAADVQGTGSMVVRPKASFEDGVYLVRVEGDDEHGWAFVVGNAGVEVSDVP